jgi:hypothetical protein
MGIRIAIVGFILLTGCRDATGVGTMMPTVPMLTSAPLTASIDHGPIVGQVLVWQDHSPSIGGSPDHRLQVSLELENTDRAPFDSGFTLERVWVVFGTTTWTAVPRKQQFSESMKRLSVGLSGGPAWPVSSSVVVVIRLSDRLGTRVLLRSMPTTINAVE